MIQITYYKCTYEDGTTIQNCQNVLPTINGSACNNLLKSLNYILQYNSTVGGVVEAGVEAVFFNYINYLTNTQRVQQHFGIYYIPSTVQLADFDTLKSDMLSGNPGYLFEKPIRAGVSINSVIK